MADLSAFRVDAKARQEGQWVRVGEEFLDLEVLVRGLTDRYTDAVAARSRQAARSYGGDVQKLPAAIARGIVVSALCDHVLLDVRNLKDGDRDITIDEFKQLLRDENYFELVNAVLRATALVGQARAEDLMEAVGNSGPASAGA